MKLPYKNNSLLPRLLGLTLLVYFAAAATHTIDASQTLNA